MVMMELMVMVELMAVMVMMELTVMMELMTMTNLIYDASATVNLGAEFALAPKWTLDLSANYNGWDIKSDKKWKHWMAQPEARYWFCHSSWTRPTLWPR